MKRMPPIWRGNWAHHPWVSSLAACLWEKSGQRESFSGLQERSVGYINIHVHTLLSSKGLAWDGPSPQMCGHAGSCGPLFSLFEPGSESHTLCFSLGPAVQSPPSGCLARRFSCLIPMKSLQPPMMLVGVAPLDQ